MLRKAFEDNEISRLKKRIAKGELGANLTRPGGRVRKGKAKSYLEDLSTEEIREIDERMLKKLTPEAKQLLARYFIEE